MVASEVLMRVLIVTLVCWEKTINFDKVITVDIKTKIPFGLLEKK